MKKTIKTSEVLAAYNVLNAAKYGSMEDGDKIKVWKITRALKPIATKFDEDSKDAAEKMKPKYEGGFDETLQKAQEYERMIRDSKVDAKKLPMGAAEYDAFIKEFEAYNELVGKAVEDFAKKEVAINIELLSDDAFGKLMASNDWTFGQTTALSEIICEPAEAEEEEKPKDKKKK
jgi:hypothetical protein